MMRRVDTKQKEMMEYINTVSFAVLETSLYLDTHPTDMVALNFFKKYSTMRNDAMAEYAKLYSPLTIDYVVTSDADYWNWINQPWPWEVGGY